MNATPCTTEAALRHRLLEGMLLRLARLPDAAAFILRGGMLLRHWFRPLQREARDLDLVATFPFSVEEAARRFVPALADRDVADGVTFDVERYRVEGIWLNTDFPGVRIFATGQADGDEADFSVDLTFGEPLIPLPVASDYPMQGTPLTARLWLCRPETIVGRKLHALLHMGMQHWRPKDLNDLRLLLARLPLDPDDLVAAIAASFTSRGDSTAAARSLFQREWWGLKTSAVRWRDFVRSARGLEVPDKLAQVVAEVVGKLTPILERLP